MLKYVVHGCLVLGVWVFCAQMYGFHRGVWIFISDVWVFNGAWVFKDVRVWILFVSPTNPHNLGYKEKLPFATTSFSLKVC